MNAIIHRDQFKNIPSGENFWLIQKNGDLYSYVFASEAAKWTADFRNKGIGVVSKCPNGDYLASIQINNKFHHRFIYKWGKTQLEAREKAFSEFKEEKEFADAMEVPEKELEYRRGLFNKDSNFHNSDDHRVWSAGQANLNRIKELEKIVSGQ